jgi:CelD/BcsL family acetyltransferase involved in cellulose biosynthesis
MPAGMIDASELSVVVRRFESLQATELAAWRYWTEFNVLNQRAFLTSNFCEAVATTNPHVRVLLLYHSNELVGVLPLQPHGSWAGRCGVYEPVGGAMSDYFGVIGKSGSSFDIKVILAKAGIGAVVFTHLDESQLNMGLVGEMPRVGLRTIISGLRNDHWERLRAKDKKLVSDTERRERKLVAEHGPIEFELQSANSEADLQELIALKLAQYDRTGRHEASLFSDANVQLLYRLLRADDPQCTGVLSVLRVNKKLVAAHFGLRCLNVLHFWFPVYAVEYSAYSPGRILYRHIISSGSEMGIQILDRGEGDTSAKREFANEEHTYYSGIWWPHNFRGLVGRLAITAMWRFSK